MTTLSLTAQHLTAQSLAPTTSDGPAGEIFTGVFIAGLAVVGIALVALFVAALVSIVRSPLEIVPKLAWVAIVLVLQLIGPLLWFAVGRRMARSTPSAGGAPLLDR